MNGLHFAVLLFSIYSVHSSLIGPNKYYAKNAAPIKFIKVNNIKELLNGGSLNLNEAKFIKSNNGKTKELEKSKPDGKSLIIDNKSKVDSEDDNKTIVAVGSKFSDLAVLVPANISVLQKSNIHPQHIIGYVPFKTPNGQPLVLPAGAVRVFDVSNNTKQLKSNIGEKNSKLFDKIEAKTAGTLQGKRYTVGIESRNVKNRALLRIHNSRHKKRRQNNGKHINRRNSHNEEIKRSRHHNYSIKRMRKIVNRLLSRLKK